MSLTLYRRHRKACTKGYPVQHVSTETNDWERARATAERWETWEALTNPNPEAASDAPRTVDEVVAAFQKYHGPDFKDWNKRFLQKFNQMFRLRLKRFCEAEKIEFIGRFDDRQVVNRFVTSWRNMNPLRNRKLLPGEKMPTDVPLGYRTKTKELERFRYFSGWCVDSKYLKENHAKKIKLAYQKTDPKFGLLPHEVDRVFDTIEKLEDCYGRKNRRNYQETYAFVLVNRHTGLTCEPNENYRSPVDQSNEGT